MPSVVVRETKVIPFNRFIGLLIAGLCFFAGSARADTATDVTNIQAAGYGGLYVGNRAPLEPSPLLRLPPGSIQPQGWLYTTLENQRNGLNGLQEEISPFLQFSTSDWTTTNGSGATQGWERVPYWLRGYIDMGYSLDDPSVISNATRWIKGVMVSERTNGYFGPAQDYGDATTASDLGINAPDLWPDMPMLDAMRSYYDYSGDTNALNLMDHYCAWENSLPPSDFGAGYWPMMRMGDNIESVYWLYNRTGQSWLLNLATNMYVNMARWDTANTLPNWHNVNIAEGFRAPTVFWQQSRNPIDLQFAEANYQTVMGQYGQVPGGGFGGDEVCRADYYGPQQGFETCGIVEFMRSFEILTRITGSPVWAERCEDLAANTFPAAMRTNMLSLHYLTAPNQPELDDEPKAPDINNGGSPWFSQSPSEPNYWCCEHNHGMGWPYFCEETWLATWDDGLCASLYAPTMVTARVGNGSTVSVTENTTYPFSGTVQLNVTTTNSVAFPLYVRVPQWCSNNWIQVNGQTVATNSRASSYVCIQRTWTNGDQVVLNFTRQITLRTWATNNNCVSVNYGPLTFSLEIPENWQAYGNNEAPWTQYQVYPGTNWNYGLVLYPTNPAVSFTVVTNPGPIAANPFSLQTTPIQLQAQARQIPAWTLDSLYDAGTVWPSPIYSTQAVQTVTLVPMGAARLRISAFPTVTTNAAATQWGAPYAPGASYVNSSDTLSAMNLGLNPTNSSEQMTRMTWWNHEGTTEWVQATFNGLCQVSQMSVYWYDDVPIGGGCNLPQSWWVEYLVGTNWVMATGASGYGVSANTYNTVTFNPVTTTAVRLYVQLQSGYSGGILGWRVPATPVASLALHYPLHGNLTDTASGQTGTLYGGTFVPDRFGTAASALQFNGTSTNYAIIPRPNWMDWTIAFWVKTTATGSGAEPSGYSSAGKFGGSLYLNGSTTLKTLSGAFPGGLPTGNSPYTIAVWEKADSGCPNNGGFVGWGNENTSQGNNLRLNGPNSVDNYWWANDFVVSGLTANPMDGNWHSIVATWNGTTRTIYVDGTAVGSQTPSAPNVMGLNFVAGATIGDVYFKGWMENLLITTNALTPAQISTYQNNGLMPPGTVAYWQFNNPSNLGADSSGQGNTLAVGNLGGQWYQGEGLVDGNVSGTADDFGVSLLGNAAAFGVGNPDTTITSTTPINDGQWHHIAATRSAYTGQMQLYVDGTLQTAAIGPFGPKTAPPDLCLGTIQSGGGYFNGTISDVQIFNRVLNPSEISVVMNQSLILNSLGSTNLIAGQTLTFSNSAVDPYAPPRTIGWSIAGTPAGVAINPISGVLTWRPAIAQSPATYSFSITATDSGSPALSAIQYSLVTVLTPTEPQILSPAFSDGLFSFSINGNAGPDYYIEATTNLGPAAVWSPLFTNNSPNLLPFPWTDLIGSNVARQFFRIRLGP
ncbi:MAG TPA: LamG-like jellyroll fold domain-containing protein [Candidatus Saccharimonadales bacterium]|nr:LamG-like jellyroll fold domain-containing protein [Candidatus Saccharimonadales bacterium]